MTVNESRSDRIIRVIVGTGGPLSLLGCLVTLL